MCKVTIVSALCLLMLGHAPEASAQAAAPANLARGKYLTSISGCNDCHTPGNFLGKRDTSRTLGGSEVAFVIPGLGAFVPPNLTPDKETGLGNWSEGQIVAAIRTGKRPDGRELAPIMPWRDLAALTDSDARSIALYLKNLAPVKNKVPGPFGPNDPVTTFTMKVSPPAQATTSNSNSSPSSQSSAPIQAGDPGPTDPATGMSKRENYDTQLNSGAMDSSTGTPAGSGEQKSR